MKKFVTLILICITIIGITGCGTNKDSNNKEESNNASQSQKENASNTKNGMYEWKVGKTTLKTKTNIMDYIDGENWNIKAMSEELGYYPVEAYGRVDTRHYRNKSNPIVDLKFEASTYYGRFFIDIFNDPSEKSIMLLSITSNHTDKEYNFGDGSVKVPFELIVAYTYAAEHLSVDSSTDPFNGIIEIKDSNGYALN